MSSFWKTFPPGWFAWESWEYEYEGDLGEGDDDDDDDEEEEEEDDDEGDGDGGIDYGWENDFGDGGGDFDRDDGGRDFDTDFDQDREEREREREEEQRRREEEQRRREEEERQRRIEEQQRQIEENRRRMEEEQRRRQEDMDGDGQIELTEQVAAQSGFVDEGSPAVNEPLREQFQEYVEQNQQGFSTNDPAEMEAWLQGQQARNLAAREPGREYTSGRVERTPSGIRVSAPGSEGFATDRPEDMLAFEREQGDIWRQGREPGREYTPIAQTGPAYKPSPALEPPRPQPSRVPEIAATAAAQAVASAGGGPQDVAAAAEYAARQASDRQTLAGQSAWTRAAFRSTYGDQAEAEWVRQHEAELQRNVALYGSREPRAGTAPIAQAPAGTPTAPDRRIGAVPGPGPMEDARYGITTRASQPPAAAAPPQSARVAPPGTASPAAGGPGVALPVQGASAVPERPDDQVLIVDTTSGNQKWVRRDQLAPWLAPVAPNIPSPWQVRDFRPAPAEPPARANPPQRPLNPDVPGGGLSPADQGAMDRGAPIGAPTSFGPAIRPSPTVPRDPNPPSVNPPLVTPSGGGLSAADQAEMDAAATAAANRPPISEYSLPRPDDILDLEWIDDPRSTRQITRAEWEASSPQDQSGWRNTAVRRNPQYSEPYDPGRSYDPNTTESGPTITINSGDPYPTTPDGRRIMRAGPQDVEIFPDRYQPIRNIVDYDPATGQTRERGYGTQTMASTDTSIQPAPAPRYPVPAVGEDLTPSIPPTPAVGSDPVTLAIDNPRPLDALASLAAATKDPDLPRTNDAYHIAHGIAGMLRGDTSAVWAEPYLNDVARLAWAREERQNGRGNADPRLAPVEYVEKWKDAFYGSDHNVPLVKEVDQQMIDYAARRTPPGKPFKWQEAYGPTGEKGLIEPQATLVDCGPAALAALLKSQGYNANPRQTFQFALTNKYHNGNEFNGPQAMVNMIRNETGLDARSVPIDLKGTNWDQIDKELAEGRPVLLSSRGHWWTLSAKNEKGQYYVGGSALKGNPSWMPRGGFRYGGDADTAVLTRGQVNPDSRAVKAMGLKPPVMGTPDTRPLLSGNTEFVSAQGRGGVQPSGRPSEPMAAVDWVRSPGAQRIPEPYRPFAAEAAAANNLDPDWLAAIMKQESGGDPNARSGKGASGLMQLMPATARAMGVQNLTDPRENLMGGAKYFKMMLDQHDNDPRLALAAYNAGPGAVKQYGGIPPYRETQHYVDVVMKNYQEIKAERAQIPGGQRGGPEAPVQQYMSPADRLGNRLMAEMTRDTWAPEGREGEPGPYRGQRPIPEDIAWFADANPDAGLYAGDGRGRDVGAKVWNTALDMTGDSRFATLVGGLVNGEGGFSGKQDEVGATGIFQFDPRFAEGKEFAKWLKEHGIQENPQTAARNIEYAMGYYLPYIKDAYDSAVARGVTDENALLTAMVKEPSRRGYGHNSGSSGANLMNYINGLAEFKRGEFRLLPRNRW